MSENRLYAFGPAIITLRGLNANQIAHEFSFLSSIPSSQCHDPLGFFDFKQNGAEFDLHVDGKPVAGAAPLSFLAEYTWSKVQSLLARSRPDLLFLRGEVVQLASGGGILLAGPAFSGQTTLARALGGQSWSSHYAVLGPDGQARRYPQLDSEALPVSLISTLRYRPGASLSADLLTPGPCALALTALLEGDEGVVARALSILAGASSRAVARLAGVRGEAHEAVQTLRSYLERAGPSRPE